MLRLANFFSKWGFKMVLSGIEPVGDFFIFLGVAAMYVLSIAAYVALICLLIAAASKGGGGGGGFFIIYSGGPYGGFGPMDMAASIVIGLIVSAIVVGVAMHMGLPSIALGFGVAWCAAFSSVLLGLTIRASGSLASAASSCSQRFWRPETVPAIDHHTGLPVAHATPNGSLQVN